jgi:hypothetical protein
VNTLAVISAISVFSYIVGYRLLCAIFIAAIITLGQKNIIQL